MVGRRDDCFKLVGSIFEFSTKYDLSECELVERRKKRGGRCGRRGTMGTEKVPAADERER